MTAKEFLDRAKGISKDPLDRLTPHTRTMIDKQDCIFDVHCHVFDRKCINIGYFLLRLAGTAFRKVIRRYLMHKQSLAPDYLERIFLSDDPVEAVYAEFRTSPGFAALKEDDEWEKLERVMNEIQTENAANNFADVEGVSQASIDGLWHAFKVILKGSMQKVYDHFLARHCVHALDEYNGRPFVTVLLMMDLESGWRMRAPKSYMNQVTEVNLIAREHPVLPFLALDPSREDLYELFLRAFTESGSHFFGVKAYPSFGYSPADHRLHPIWEVCEDFNIPVVTHCGGTTVSTFDSRVEIYDCPSDIPCRPRTVTGTRVEMATALNEPAQWKLVLEAHKGLKLNLGHFGGEDAWSAKYPSPRVKVITDFMSVPGSRVFADFSFNLEEGALDARLKSALDSSKLMRGRTMFGTDYWVVLPSGDLLTNTSRFLQGMGSHAEGLLGENPRRWLFSQH